MPRKHFWFKFEWGPWRNDKQLRKCSKETRGFWIDAIAAMEEHDTYFLDGTIEELCRVIVCSREEFDRSLKELMRTNAASITKSKGTVKIISRKILKGVNLTEYNKLKQRESRTRRSVKTKSNTISKELDIKSIRKKNSNNVDSVSGAPAEILERPPLETKTKVEDPRKSHPVIVALRDVTNAYPPKETWDELIDQIRDEVIDLVKLKKCFTKWRSRGYNKFNYAWATEWYVHGIPQERQSNGANGTNRQPPERRDSTTDRLSRYDFSEFPTEEDLGRIS